MYNTRSTLKTFRCNIQKKTNKHLKQASETFTKTHEKYLKIIDLLLKHPDTTVATYKRRQMKHLKQTFKTFTKTPKKHLKTIANICNI
jgi:hypothetical protein